MAIRALHSLVLCQKKFLGGWDKRQFAIYFKRSLLFLLFFLLFLFFENLGSNNVFGEGKSRIEGAPFCIPFLAENQHTGTIINPDLEYKSKFREKLLLPPYLTKQAMIMSACLG